MGGWDNLFFYPVPSQCCQCMPLHLLLYQSSVPEQCLSANIVQPGPALQLCTCLFCPSRTSQPPASPAAR